MGFYCTQSKNFKQPYFLQELAVDDTTLGKVFNTLTAGRRASDRVRKKLQNYAAFSGQIMP